MSENEFCCYLGFKTKLDPTKAQAEYFARACGTARLVFNWGLGQWKKQYEEYKNGLRSCPPNAADLKKQLTQQKKEGEKFFWMKKVTKCAPQYALTDLGIAFKHFFEDPENFEYPKFKKKGSRRDSFRLDNSQFKVENNRIRIPHIKWVRMHERLRFRGAKLLWATISREADGWYVGITLELHDLDHLSPAENQGRIGVDLGVKNFATLSNGLVFEGPKPLKKYSKKLARLQRKFARTEKSSRNRVKLRTCIARLHKKISDVRLNAIHQLTSFLTANYSVICIEDLNVKGMMKNHCLARAISDMGFYEFRRQMEYKVKQRGGRLVIASRWFPSSRMCRFCGLKNKDLKLKDRWWTCPHCGLFIPDRDLNAAINLRNYINRVDKTDSCSDSGSVAVNNQKRNAVTSESYPDVSPAGEDPSRLKATAERLGCQSTMQTCRKTLAGNDATDPGENSKAFYYGVGSDDWGSQRNSLPGSFGAEVVSMQTVNVQVCVEAQ
ncbi:MAG: transposase [Mesosutterella multiformis]|nr:transposase [Mesosutterella multiformis]